MDRLEAMRLFVAVVEAGGFSAAARNLRLPLSTVSRKVADLEQRVGSQLLVRTTRRVEVTDSGWHYYRDATSILEAVEAQERRAAGEFEAPKGHLVITAPTLFGRRLLLPIVVDFMERHLDITVRLQFTNAVIDLLAEHVDLALRIGPLADSSQIAARVGQVREVICASPDYLDRRGRPHNPSEISRHHCISFAQADGAKEWTFSDQDGNDMRVSVSKRLTLNSVEGIVLAAKAGAGLAMVYSYQVADEIAKGELEIVLAEYEPPLQPVSFIYPQTRELPQKTRAFIDFAQLHLKQSLDEIATKCR
jgi:DNA-binding transcriptional LysR family regulator